MNSVDHDPKKFDKDSYGNLYPKGTPADGSYGKNVIPDVEPDAEIQNECGLVNEQACCSMCTKAKTCSMLGDCDFEPEIHRPHRSK